MALQAGDEQRGEAIAGCGLEAGALALEEADQVDMALLAGDEQRGQASQVSRIDARTAGEQPHHALELAESCRSTEQGVAPLVLSLRRLVV